MFFALWPDQSVRQQISSQFQSSSFIKSNSAKLYRVSNLHLTLHFLGNVSTEQLNCIKYQAGTVGGVPFKLLLNHYGKFGRAAVLWMGLESLPDALLKLQRSLGESLKLCGYVPDNREYRPHITLMRKFHDHVYDQNLPPIEWFIDRYALVESVSDQQGVIYKPLQFYKL